ncbi:hypothetical protein [Acidimangrovimonas sediminis]|uniref:hypothetical protein n=1 Tax=Acidimangrovimonas sediminis TaxID=2056283 RepID=UPI001E321A3F|nr:hypothetical protein [Acidimangrovimonas sediminis]
MAKTFDTPVSGNALAPIGAQIAAVAKSVFGGFVRGLDAYMTARSRRDQIERLNAKSDEELAQMGLKREDIPRHVFRDLIGF